MTTPELTPGQCAALASLLEASAPKVGNVHRGADFDDLRFPDLMVSALVIAPAMELASEQPLGRTVLSAVQATQQYVGTNANLGIILLLAPLAAVSRSIGLQPGVRDVLSQLAPDDARDVYEAIRLARPGGMGVAEQMDIADGAPLDLLLAMRHAQHRDLVARQYANGFREVFDQVAPWLCEARSAGSSLTQSIVHVHVRLLAKHGDSLIARKCGPLVAQQAQAMAEQVLAAGPPGSENYERGLADLDFWMRCDGHRRNPGTTADLIAAGLFVGLRERRLLPPWR